MSARRSHPPEVRERALRLRSEGLLLREVAEITGVSKSTISQWEHDPDGSRAQARKDRYRLPCPTCGTMMSGSNGLAGAPAECAACCQERQHDERTWTRDTIVAAIQDNAVDGRAPSASEVRAAGLWAMRTSARREFGSWAAACEVAGVRAIPTGRYVLRVPPTVTTALAAVAWTWDVPAEAYRLEMQT